MNYQLEDLIDLKLLKQLQEKLADIYSVPSAIINKKGVVLTAVAWQDLCTKFHRKNSACLKECIKSDQYILSHLKEANPAVSYRCVHGLMDSATPIYIDGVHLANFFTGQFFLESPDIDFFRKQAQKYGFEEQSYLEAVEKVPIWTVEKLNKYLDFIKEFVDWIARTGIIQKRAIEAGKKSEQLLRQTLLQKEEIELNNRRLESLLRISQYKSRSKQDLLDYALEEAISLSNSKIGYIYYYDEDKQQFSLNTWSKDVLKECAVVNPRFINDLEGTGCWGEPVRNRKPLVINNFTLYNASRKGTPEGHVKLKKFLTVPVFLDDSIVAVVGVANKSEDYNQTDVHQLTLLMDVVWKILDRVEMTEHLRKSKEKAEESERLKTAFLANMSHEIRTPMNGILGFAGLLREPELTDEEKEEYINIIEKSGRRMLNILNDIISISKVESGLMQLSLKETNVNDQVTYIHTFFKPEAEKKGIEITYSLGLPEKEAILKTDKEKLYAILTNLVKNAIKFTEQGKIELGYNRKENFLEFYVQDTGSGIDPDHQKIIFERFRQANESLSRNYEGAGLGLSISKAYAEMLGGKIWVQSSLGKGSVFYFTIPYLQMEPENNLVDGSNTLPFENKSKTCSKILIAEDDDDTDFLLRKTIHNWAYEILRAKTGEEAVATVLKNPDIDLVLMDIKMPVLDGFQATKRIREFNSEIIIIAQTAFALLSDRERAIEAGCNDYISKPIDSGLLNQLLETYLFQNKKRRKETE